MARGKSLDLVDSYTKVPLASPCELSWEDLVGGDKERRCARCSKTVLDLSAMTRTEATIRLLNVVGTPCIRYELGRSGEVAFVPESELLDRSDRPRGTPILSPRAIAIAVGVSTIPLAACSKKTQDPVVAVPCGVVDEPVVESRPKRERHEVFMGKAAGPTSRTGRLARAGYLTVQSHQPVIVTIAGVELVAPFREYALPPGTHTLLVPGKDGKKTRFVTIIADEIVTEAID